MVSVSKACAGQSLFLDNACATDGFILRLENSMSWAYSAGFRWLPNPKRKINSLAHSKLVLVARKLRQMILELVGGLHKRFFHCK